MSMGQDLGSVQTSAQGMVLRFICWISRPRTFSQSERTVKCQVSLLRDPFSLIPTGLGGTL